MRVQWRVATFGSLRSALLDCKPVHYTPSTRWSAAAEGGLSPAAANRFEGPSPIRRTVTQTVGSLQPSVLLAAQSEREFESDLHESRWCGTRGSKSLNPAKPARAPI
jgi:hypothetical protein